jgi:cyclase
MLRPRLIPVLLLQGAGLVKTKRFKDPIYVGDPVNVVRIFNDKEVDEIVILDIAATPARRGPDLDLIGRLTGEAFMPVCYGGGVTSIETMKTLFRLGVEKIALNTAAHANPSLVRQASELFGSQAVVVSLDVKRRWLGGAEVRVEGGRRGTGQDPVAFARVMEDAGAGEFLVHSIDRDGTREGYDLDLVGRVAAAVRVPVIACGGAGTEQDFRNAMRAGAAACAAGSMFVFQPRTGAVLISYPDLSGWTAE